MQIIRKRYDELHNIHSDKLLNHLYNLRNLKTHKETQKYLKNLITYHSLKDIEKSSLMLANAILDKKKIVIIGDFDVDGATSVAIAYQGLTMLNCKNVEYLIPNRFICGYGLSKQIIQKAVNLGAEIILTVDNGTSSFEGVDYAKSYGLKVIITDHHLQSDSLPNADIVINPNRLDDEFESKNLAGCGVIFYVIWALRDYLIENNIFQNIPSLKPLLDLVALGTISDIVSLDYNNRILVHQGLEIIRKGHSRRGIYALLTDYKKPYSYLTSYDLGYIVSPKLNAAGRMKDMTLSVNLLLSDNECNINRFLQELLILNQNRKCEEQVVLKSALDKLKNISKKSAICVFDENWHQGVVGIVAARIKDKYDCPSLIFTKLDDYHIKGSARSIPQIHLRDILAKISNEKPYLIEHFGGHHQACGIVLKSKHFDEFQMEINQQCYDALNGQSFIPEILTDGVLEKEYFDLSIIKQLRTIEPWGHHFPFPLFDGVFNVLSFKALKKSHLKMLLQVPNSNILVNAICFYADLEMFSNNPKQVHLVYQVDINVFQQEESVSLIVKHLKEI